MRIIARSHEEATHGNPTSKLSSDCARQQAQRHGAGELVPAVLTARLRYRAHGRRVLLSFQNSRQAFLAAPDVALHRVQRNIEDLAMSVYFRSSK